MLLRLKFPVFHFLQEFTSVTLDDVSSSVVKLIIDIAYGTDRLYRVVFLTVATQKNSKYKKKPKYPNCSHGNSFEMSRYGKSQDIVTILH